MKYKRLPHSATHQRVVALSRSQKKAVMVVADLIALPGALLSAYMLRLSTWWPVEFLQPAWWLFAVLPILGVFVFARIGLYRAVIRFMGAHAILAITKGVAVLAVVLACLAYAMNVSPFPRSVPVNFALVALVYVGGTRLLVRQYYQWLVRHFVDKKPVLIYGAGGAGVQLAAALDNGGDYFPVGFVDDDPRLWGEIVRGRPVHRPKDIEALLVRYGIRQVLLAIPAHSRDAQRSIVERLLRYSVQIQTVPSMAEIVEHKVAVEQLREIQLEDLLGREPVPAIPELLERSIVGKSVLITGGGGSIGAEIARQVIAHIPTRLIILEQSEYALYQIALELEEIRDSRQIYGVEVIPVLGSVCDGLLVEKTLVNHKIQTVYHAAAYKHVPIIEENIQQGIRNNILGTATLAHLASKVGVERFVLISTDKAVRPTNVMGATKRVAEQVLQSLVMEGTQTRFCMVRFGNVLGSSGSVVPRFRAQVEQGGPVTVTHPDITRYFMTIEEASSLVIQAGSMAKGGEVFVLDMGEPVKIRHLAEKIIVLMGYTAKSEDNPKGDIAIRYTGLRKGEKLYEELLIGSDSERTSHPKIMKAMEECVEYAKLAESLSVFENLLLTDQEDSDLDNILCQLLGELVSGFSRVQEVESFDKQSLELN
ncbi:polysaccharide biosynthesis protein [Pokkaliibacter plantistimulans]|uniref:Polysaccharide biosynthesis protein n=2 Tax=Pseudomonadota TaxID=1224 RepID=A0A2S5KIU2_9PROT|nr:polysaccharide biosynthesis protein [Pokkaliibacter plantistimulans]